MKGLPLNHIAEISVGYQSRARIADGPSGSHRLVQGRDLRPNAPLYIESLLRFNPVGNSEHCAIRPGDVLFQARGNDHFAYYVAEAPENTLAASTFYVLRPKGPDLLPCYLAWWINQKPAQQFLRATSQAATIPYVSKSALSEMEIRVPDFRTQEMICRVTDLMRRGHVLQNEIDERRTKLIDAICRKSLTHEGGN
jgi:hypothetical protein